jgi:hypothetical protein
VNEDCSVFIMIKVQSILFPRERNSNALGRSLSTLGNTMVVGESTWTLSSLFRPPNA